MKSGEAPVAVLDASALLAYMYDEPGADRVHPVLQRGVLISAVNWAEVLADLAERGEPVETSAPRVKTAATAAGSLVVVPFDQSQAIETARLRAQARALGLSLADRACLALARLHRLPVLTTDRAWRSLHISVKIEVIR